LHFGERGEFLDGDDFFLLDNGFSVDDAGSG
jgi:hypothetical protein